MWGQASSIQGQIDAAPVRTSTDFSNLRDLESRADTYAAIGNVSFVGGIVIAGISGYYAWRDHRRHRSGTALITPAVFDRGAGIALTFGGAP